MSSRWLQPKPVLGSNAVYPHYVVGIYLPEENEIPDEYWELLDSTIDHRVKFLEQWIYTNKRPEFFLKEKQGVDKTEALEHLRVCIESVEPFESHKIAGCLVLLDNWFILVKEKGFSTHHVGAEY